MNSVEMLDKTIAERLARPELYPNSSTVLLASSGLCGVAEKIGEETGELIQAVVCEEDEAVLNEAQQVLYMTAVGVALSRGASRLSASMELAAREGPISLRTQNEIVKNLGRKAAAFSFSLGNGSDVLRASANLVSVVDAAARFRQLTMARVLERI